MVNIGLRSGPVNRNRITWLHTTAALPTSLVDAASAEVTLGETADDEAERTRPYGESGRRASAGVRRNPRCGRNPRASENPRPCENGPSDVPDALLDCRCESCGRLIPYRCVFIEYDGNMKPDDMA